MNWEESIPERFRARYDSQKDCWYVLDTWHPQIKNMSDLTVDIPDNSPAMKIISGSEMNAIMGEIKKMGWEDKIINEPYKKGIISNNKESLSFRQKIDKIYELAFGLKQDYYSKKKKTPSVEVE